jgi:cobalt-zinc-cadmium efflux system membrane fusion protein
MKKTRTALYMVLIGAGLALAVFVSFHLSPSALLAVESTKEKAHDHSKEEPGVHAGQEKKVSKPAAAPKDDHAHAEGEEHPGHKHEDGEVAHKDEHGKDHSDHKQGAGKDAHKDEPGKAHSGHKEPQAKGKKDEHGQDEHEEEQIVRLNEAEMKQYGIEVATAGEGNLESIMSLPGEVALNADRVTHIVPRIPGVVKEVRKKLGDIVRQGEVMAIIESRELADAKAEYLAGLERVNLAQAKFSREERLWKKKISAEQEYLDAKQALAEARITLRTSEQKLYALGFSNQHVKQLPSQPDHSLTRFEIIAPFDSTVIEKHISLGEMLKDDTEAFVVADLSSVWVNLNVYQKDLGKIRSGQRVLINLGQEGEQSEGRIAFVEPVVKGETRTALARVIAPNPDRMWHPGMFVTAKVLTDDARAAIVAPQTALQNLGEQTVVFVKTREGFEPRVVKTGRSTEGGIEIVSGLKAGERYASKGTLTLKAQVSKSEFGGHSH